MDTKTSQRKICKERLAQMSDKIRREASDRIQSLLLKWPGFLEGNIYFLYSALRSEPDLDQVFNVLIQQGKIVVFPLWHGEKQCLTWHRVSQIEELEKTDSGIREPKFSEETRVLPESADWILVPGLGFDKTGARLGRGAGMYDRTLAASQGRAKRMGVFFSVQELDQIVCESHDERLHGVVTENEVIFI